MFWFFGREACGILAPWPRIEPAPTALEGEVLTTGPPGKSLNEYLLNTTYGGGWFLYLIESSPLWIFTTTSWSRYVYIYFTNEFMYVRAEILIQISIFQSSLSLSLVVFGY